MNWAAESQLAVLEESARFQRRAQLGLPRFARLVVGAAIVAAPALLACTKAQETAVATDLSQGCELALDFLDPTLAPLCTTFALAGQAIAAVMPSDAGATDAGAVNVALIAVQSATPAQKAAVYAWLVAHGAVPLGG